MAVTAQVPGRLGESLLNGEVDLDTATVKVLLTTSGYTFDADTHRYRSSVTNEVSATGYTAGGATVANSALTYDSATNTVRLDGDDVVWTADLTAHNAIWYVDTGDAATDVILAVWVSDTAVTSSNGGTFTLTPHANGLLTLAAA